MVMFDGIPTITGWILSITVTSCVAVDEFPAASVAVHVTVVVPRPKTGGASFVTELNVQLSVALGFPRLVMIASQLELALIVILAGAEIVGAIASSAVIVIGADVVEQLFEFVTVTVYVVVVDGVNVIAWAVPTVLVPSLQE